MITEDVSFPPGGLLRIIGCVSINIFNYAAKVCSSVVGKYSAAALRHTSMP